MITDKHGDPLKPGDRVAIVLNGEQVATGRVSHAARVLRKRLDRNEWGVTILLDGGNSTINIIHYTNVEKI